MFTEKELELIQQSYLAFKADEAQYFYVREQTERMLDGEIVTELESDNPELVYREKSIAVRKRVESLKQNAQSRKAKRVAEKKYLQRRSSRSVQSITNTLPDIGSTIEEFVKDWH